jgi:ABC-type phosphonate transport system ATPase subunit
MRSAIDGAAYWCALAPPMTAQRFTAASMVSNWFVLRSGTGLPRIVDSILDVLQMLHRQEGLTVLLVEQNVPAALAAAERGDVLQTGRIVAEGTSQTLLDSDLVRRAYLGM